MQQFKDSRLWIDKMQMLEVEATWIKFEKAQQKIVDLEERLYLSEKVKNKLLQLWNNVTHFDHVQPMYDPKPAEHKTVISCEKDEDMEMKLLEKNLLLAATEQALQNESKLKVEEKFLTKLLLEDIEAGICEKEKICAEYESRTRAYEKNIRELQKQNGDLQELQSIREKNTEVDLKTQECEKAKILEELANLSTLYENKIDELKTQSENLQELKNIREEYSRKEEAHAHEKEKIRAEHTSLTRMYETKYEQLKKQNEDLMTHQSISAESTRKEDARIFTAEIASLRFEVARLNAYISEQGQQMAKLYAYISEQDQAVGVLRAIQSKLLEDNNLLENLVGQLQEELELSLQKQSIQTQHIAENPLAVELSEQAEVFGLKWELFTVFVNTTRNLWENLELHKKALGKVGKGLDLESIISDCVITKTVDVCRESTVSYVFGGSSFFSKDRSDQGILAPLNIRFKNKRSFYSNEYEEGMDDGGLTNEFFTLFFEQLELFTVNGQKMFEKVCQEGSLMLPTLFADAEGAPCSLPASFEKKYVTFGRMLLRAILFEKMVPSAIASSLLMDYLMGWDRRRLKTSCAQMRAELIALDPRYCWVLTKIDEALKPECATITFADILANEDLRTIQSSEDAQECLKTFIHQQVIAPRLQQLDWILQGFQWPSFNILPFLENFSYEEMKLKISGYEEFNGADILCCLHFVDFILPHESDVIEYFKKAITEMDEAQNRCFVRFVSGLNSLPPGTGFKITVRPLCLSSESHLRQTIGYPIAHTCLNELEVPIYSSAEELTKRLFEAIRTENLAGGFTID